MEFLNRIEIRGIIGSVSVKQIGNAKNANISVVTEYFHTAKDGCAVIETTWHRVDAWEGNLIRNLDQLKKGSCIHVVGRVRAQKYIAADGLERTVYGILASELEIEETT